MTRKAKPSGAPETGAALQAMSKAELADAYGPLAAKLKVLEKRVEAFKSEFERRDLTLLVGERWSVLKTESGFNGVDVAKAKLALGPAWCAANTQRVTRVSWKANALTEADKATGEGT